MRSNRQPIQKARWAIAVALVLWCAGAGCMLGTYAHAAMRDHEQAQTGGLAMTGLSVSAGAHSCCKARHSSQHVVSESSAGHASLAAGFEEVALRESSNSSETTSCC